MAQKSGYSLRDPLNPRALVPKPLRPIARWFWKRLVALSDPEQWSRRGYAMPAPVSVKWAVLSRYGGAADTWIETGTFYGDTTNFLAGLAKRVYSIEPEPHLANLATKRFAKRDNVSIIQGLSEECFGEVLDHVHGSLSVWLDGHFSSGVTFQGPVDTPIRQELDALAQRIENLEIVAVCIDDVRCFDPNNLRYSGYPSRSWLVEWADSLGLIWTIEHDIFVAVQQGRASLAKDAREEGT